MLVEPARAPSVGYIPIGFGIFAVLVAIWRFDRQQRRARELAANDAAYLRRYPLAEAPA